MKLKASDNMAPIRQQLLGFIEPDDSVVEFGCGSGDLLFGLAGRIKAGLGIDNSAISINKALREKEKRGLQHIDFACASLGYNYLPAGVYDVAIASLFFHVIPRQEAIYILKKMRELTGNSADLRIFAPGNIFTKAVALARPKALRPLPEF